MHITTITLHDCQRLWFQEHPPYLGCWAATGGLKCQAFARAESSTFAGHRPHSILSLYRSHPRVQTMTAPEAIPSRPMDMVRRHHLRAMQLNVLRPEEETDFRPLSDPNPYSVHPLRSPSASTCSDLVPNWIDCFLFQCIYCPSSAFLIVLRRQRSSWDGAALDNVTSVAHTSPQ
jgi:hypothetical protein